MDRLHELFCLLDRLEQLVAPDKPCTCTVQEKFSSQCVFDNKNGSKSLSSFEQALAQSCQCRQKADTKKSIVYDTPAAHVTEVRDEPK